MKINTEALVDRLSYWNHAYDKDNKEIRLIEKEFNIEYISVSVEKHNVLQYTYYFEVDFGSDKSDQIFFIEIENGINNGTQINHADWINDTKPESRMIEILKDVVLDKSQYPDLKERRKAQATLNSNKQKFFEFNRQNNYDNYVTGGNSKLKIDKILSQLHVEYIYEEIEVDVNLI